ncbi:hypothetical protein F5148DRAFT_418746 [Russula earlei]|uniref:Uncharacterized protein n=1 Tax=Russula earlei TaxID=71964 RepID=A0ACC0TZC3_9AGAM|nr:hypothetical protein F5148DRAFT_418746 [Russula earlei]
MTRWCGNARLPLIPLSSNCIKSPHPVADHSTPTSGLILVISLTLTASLLSRNAPNPHTHTSKAKRHKQEKMSFFVPNFPRTAAGNRSSFWLSEGESPSLRRIRRASASSRQRTALPLERQRISASRSLHLNTSFRATCWNNARGRHASTLSTTSAGAPTAPNAISSMTFRVFLHPVLRRRLRSRPPRLVLAAASARVPFPPAHTITPRA